MGRIKKVTKSKEPVRLRAKKLAGGSKSLYLDIYTDGQRAYEFLRLYLIPEKDAAAREQNRNTLQAAQAIKARRLLELTAGTAGIPAANRTRIPFADFVEAYRQRKERSGHTPTANHTRYVWRYLKEWKMDGGTLAGINKAFCMKFAERLRESGLKQATQGLYFQLLNSMLNDAVRGGLIQVNPIRQMYPEDRPRKNSPEREFLTPDEVARLAAAPIRAKDTLCGSWQILKQAFMFSCFCGLRVSDLRALRWQDITQRQGYKEVRLTMQKTGNEIILPLSEAALRWLPERPKAAQDDMPIFKRLDDYANKILKEWTANAGIKKRVSFHTARHTFATMLITQGADIYTVSKLLGHHDISVTQVYAKVVDARKVEAVNLLNSLEAAPEDEA